MKYSKIPLSQTVVGLCKMYNIHHIVISPGSRNAPLTIGFTHDDFFKCYSIVDERCAGFFALGIAQQTQMPAALVCTSGSALLNYYPAIAEAYYSNIPLVVLSADRPKHLIDIGDGQTIKQKNVYGAHVHYSANLKLDLREENNDSKIEDLPIFKSIENKLERFVSLQEDIQSYNITEIKKALSISILKSGPVHLNIPFDEPLYDKVEVSKIQINSIFIPTVKSKIVKSDIEDYTSIWNRSKRKMVLVGVLPPNSLEQKWIDKMADDESVVIFTETTSNLHHTKSFSEIDKLIAPLTTSEFKKLQPEVLLTFGGLIVSKKIKAFLRQYQPNHHWHVGLQPANDTFFVLENHINTTPNDFLSLFLPIVTPLESHYRPYWITVRNHRRAKHSEYLKNIPFSDFRVFDLLLKSIPPDSQLQVGNSSAIRYTQLFQLQNTINVFCNRGTSGIDGSTSTAIGASVVTKQRVTFVTGDLSFFYDSNALWNNYIPKSFRIILVNNQGGGIFRILPGHKNTNNFDTYFETKHKLTANQLCAMYGFQYNEASDEAQLKIVLHSFFNNSEQPKLLEIFTPARINDEILLDYFEFIK